VTAPTSPTVATVATVATSPTTWKGAVVSSDDRVIKVVGRHVAVGAVVGAAIGVVVGVVLHAIFGEVDSVTGYEFIGVVAGLVFGLFAGAFYGGASALPRDASDD
jgi:hypothetical protein